MTIGGWFFMIISVGGVSVFFAWTLFVVLTRQQQSDKQMHSTLDRTPDVD